MTDRARTLTDLLNPAFLQQAMAEAGYPQPEPVSLPSPVSPPPSEPSWVEYRGEIRFQAIFEGEYASGEPQEALMERVMTAITFDPQAPRVAWYPILRWEISEMHKHDPNAVRSGAPVDPRPIWRHPTNGTTWRVNPDGSLQAESAAPARSVTNAWMAPSDAIPPRARREMHAAMADMARMGDDYDQRIRGLEGLAQQLQAEFSRLESEGSQTGRKQRRLRRRDMRSHGPAADGQDRDGTEPRDAPDERGGADDHQPAAKLDADDETPEAGGQDASQSDPGLDQGPKSNREIIEEAAHELDPTVSESS